MTRLLRGNIYRRVICIHYKVMYEVQCTPRYSQIAKALRFQVRQSTDTRAG